MQEIVYTLRFTGHVTPIGGLPGVLKVTTTAPSCHVSTIVGPEGVRGTVRRVAGDAARFESIVRFTSETTFHESGTITFGENGHGLRFSTVGEGYIDLRRDSMHRHGSVVWRVEGGNGQFGGASGLITSNFVLSSGGAITGHHVGMIVIA